MTQTQKSRTMYMHTLDGKPAQVIRYTRGAVVMVPVGDRRRVHLLASLDEIRRERVECMDYAFRESKRDYPFSPREVHIRASAEIANRSSYVLVSGPSALGSET